MQQDKILVVDDMALNRDILKELLQDDYKVIEAGDGAQAVETVNKEGEGISLILMDIIMPGMDGFEALRILKAGGFTDKIPVIIITSAGNEQSEIKVLQNGAVDYIEKPFNPEIVKSRIATHIELKKHRMHLEELVAENVQKVVKMRDAMIDAMASLIEHRDVESGEHVARTKSFAQKIMSYIRLSGVMGDEIADIDIDLAAKAVPMHDIGKISIPDHILLKPGKLTDEEFEIMKRHTLLGAKIIDTFQEICEPKYLEYCREICLHHHERWDGKGYPHGLRGKQIPFISRIVSVVDSYDAMTSDRVYKKGMNEGEAANEMIKNSGSQFDPELVKIFLEVIRKKHETDSF